MTMNKQNLAIILSFANDLFFYSDEDEDNDRNILEKVDNYVEKTVPNMTDKQFKMHFRMLPSTFQELLNKLKSVKSTKVYSGQPPLILEKQLMITIWYLGNMESFRSVADRFGVSKSTCWDVLYRTCTLILEVNKRFLIISWPTNNQAESIIRGFKKKKMPGVFLLAVSCVIYLFLKRPVLFLIGCIGAIDGSHVKIVAPKLNHNSYVNRKSYHSVLLQGVCESNLLFTDVYAGEAGSIHDQTLFQKSDLYRRIQNNSVIFPHDSHLIGDLAYKLSEKLIVGFKNVGNLTLRQKNFNLILSKSRAAIENAFGLLKGKFRRLKYLETARLDLIPLLIVSACILHNVCILQNDLLDDLVDIQTEAQEERNRNPNDYVQEMLHDNNNARAIIKRNNIVNSLPIILRN